MSVRKSRETDTTVRVEIVGHASDLPRTTLKSLADTWFEHIDPVPCLHVPWTMTFRDSAYPAASSSTSGYVIEVRGRINLMLFEVADRSNASILWDRTVLAATQGFINDLKARHLRLRSMEIASHYDVDVQYIEIESSAAGA